MMRSAVFLLMLAVLIGAASAQVPDPTRPADAPVVTPGATGSSGGSATPAESGVQTVILRPGGKSAAVINGQYVEVGGKLGDKRVLKITESEVVLKGESGREVIKVTPAIEKMPTRKAAAIKRRATGTTE